MKVHRCGHLNCRTKVAIEERYCSQHQALHPRNKQQDRHYNMQRNADTKTKERLKFYRTKAWKVQREYIMKRDYGLCRYCQLVGQVTPAYMVDHIVPNEIAPELQLEETNLVASCKSCHNIKTKWEQEFYGTGKRNKKRSEQLLIKDVKYLEYVFKTANKAPYGFQKGRTVQ